MRHEGYSEQVKIEWHTDSVTQKVISRRQLKRAEVLMGFIFCHKSHAVTFLIKFLSPFSLSDSNDLKTMHNKNSLSPVHSHFITKNSTRVISQRGGLAILPCSVTMTQPATVSTVFILFPLYPQNPIKNNPSETMTRLKFGGGNLNRDIKQRGAERESSQSRDIQRGDQGHDIQVRAEKCRSKIDKIQLDFRRYS